jgi:ATP-dependent helicase/nuclease subunit A
MSISTSVPRPGKPAILVPTGTRALQAKASDPAASAWVSANAGSGKTTVLVRRVLRLMLSGVAPERILCLTFTTAAAANMANRLFDTLGAWVPLHDEALAADLTRVLERPPTQAECNRARQLFAEALETPGGLKIQTIHAFCTRVLQSAPFEAGIPAHFEVISETDSAAAVEAAIMRTLNLASQNGSALRTSLDRIADAVDDQRFRDLIDKALEHSGFLLGEDGQIRPWDDIRDDLATALGVQPGWTLAQLQAEGLAEIESCLDIEDMAAAIAAYGTAKEKIDWAARLQSYRGAAGTDKKLAIWSEALLTQKFQPSVAPVTKAVVTKVPSLLPRVEAAVLALLKARERINTVNIHELSTALFRVTRLILGDYVAAKRRLAVLDYGDLIVRTRVLFEDGKAAWVLYKLDAGLDHLLVDEAQDTSADQWVILNALTAEFLAGHGQRGSGSGRTIFAVGDEKQSIFGFQGAAPAAFGAQRRDLGQRFVTLGKTFHDTPLTVSFRSTRDVIKAVDAVFARELAFKGLSSDPSDKGTIHETVRGDASGAVDLWDLFEADDTEDEVVWLRPVDAPDRASPTLRLARAIAGTIRRWMDAGFDDLGRPFDPADVLILLPKRKAAFGAIVRALKDANVPVAGMDRLKLATHIAVEDMMALGRAVLLPDDDLTLATVLKGPFFGLDDDDLLRLAPGRAGSLRLALKGSAAERDRAAEDRLQAIEALAAANGPFGFFSLVLSVMGGRRAMLARLGAEAADAIDAFLMRALDHERRTGPSLARFISEVEASADDVKRDLAVAGGEVRVMTVHGAKGLEASIVFVADIGMPPTGQKIGPLLEVPLHGSNQRQGVTLWSQRSVTDNAVARKARDLEKTKAVEEHNRLLYVAMTRAENHLILCGVRPGNGAKIDASWYGLADAGLTASGPALVHAAASGPTPGFRRFKITPPLPKPAHLVAPVSATPVDDMPAWVSQPLTEEAASLPPLAAASALQAAVRPDRPGEMQGKTLAEISAAERGRFVHVLLQWLPGVGASRRHDVALKLAERHARGIPEAERTALITQTFAVMERSGLAELFGPSSLAEVEIGGDIVVGHGEGQVTRRVGGRIDRLAVTDHEVLVADFKTTRRPPREASAIPPGTLAQLAAYRALLAELYPGRPIRALVVYTAGPVVLEPTVAQLAEALRLIGETRVPDTDVTGP